MKYFSDGENPFFFYTTKKRKNNIVAEKREQAEKVFSPENLHMRHILLIIPTVVYKDGIVYLFVQIRNENDRGECQGCDLRRNGSQTRDILLPHRVRQS